MIEAEHSVNFFISILDNGYSVLITINSQINANYNVTELSKEKYFIFQYVSFDLTVPKMKKFVTKYILCYSNN